ncbi:hypothetical protein OIU78_005828 [Salix suchowensis]|nr:hypothetical protein OIU78_005828 [Salix suchowensis]
MGKLEMGRTQTASKLEMGMKPGWKEMGMKPEWTERLRLGQRLLRWKLLSHHTQLLTSTLLMQRTPHIQGDHVSLQFG